MIEWLVNTRKQNNLYLSQDPLVSSVISCLVLYNDEIFKLVKPHI